MRVILAILCLFISISALAVQPDEVLSDPALEARARDLSAELRCVVCQGENIDASNAEVARDLRLLVREKLVEGLSDEEIKDYLVERYGDYILLRPRFSGAGLVLWLSLAGILVFAIFISVRFIMASGQYIEDDDDEILSDD